MNLLNTLVPKSKKIIDQNLITINEFREFQYSLLKDLISLMITYISSQNSNYLTINDISIEEQPEYMGVNDSHYTLLNVKVNYNQEVKNFFRVLIPTLKYGCFFILSGNYYIPTLYMVDKPIVIKKKSLKLYGLFNSISIYEKFATFIGINIPANYFINLFIEDINEQNDFIRIMEIQPVQISDEELLKYFSKVFGCEADRNKIINFVENLFFDGYTQYLYQSCYDMQELSIKNILRQALQFYEIMDKNTFIDLRYKRLIFIETLLSPLLKKIGIAASQAARGYPKSILQINQLELVKHFNTKLSNKFIYDSANAFSGMLLHKVNMLNPGSENAPSIIANLHETHYQKICPISVSNQNPGETIYIVPGTVLDIIGQFVDENGVVKRI